MWASFYSNNKFFPRVVRKGNFDSPPPYKINAQKTQTCVKKLSNEDSSSDAAGTSNKVRSTQESRRLNTTTPQQLGEEKQHNDTYRTSFGERTLLHKPVNSGFFFLGGGHIALWQTLVSFQHSHGRQSSHTFKYKFLFILRCVSVRLFVTSKLHSHSLNM